MHFSAEASLNPSTARFHLDSYFTEGLSRLVGGEKSIADNLLQMEKQIATYRQKVLKAYRSQRLTETAEEAIAQIAAKPPYSLGRNEIEFPSGMSADKKKLIIADFVDPRGLHGRFGEVVKAYLSEMKARGIDLSKPAFQQAGYHTHVEFLHALCSLMSQRRLDVIEALEVLVNRANP
jgi:hypothetical protein